jgi:hypothetical protein
MTRVYLSGPIIHSSLRKDEFYRSVVEYLEQSGDQVFAPQFLSPAEPEVIYQRDVDEVRACDVLIAEVSNPSLGVGMEIMLAIEMRHPILMFRHEEAPVLSKMVVGAEGKALFHYKTTDDVLRVLRRLSLDALVVRDCPVCESHVSEAHAANPKCIVCNEPLGSE